MGHGPLVQEVRKIHTENAFLTTFLGFLGGQCPGYGQSRINFTEIKQNHEYFLIILEQFVNDINQKLSPKGVIFANQAKTFPAAGFFASRPPSVRHNLAVIATVD